MLERRVSDGLPRRGARWLAVTAGLALAAAGSAVVMTPATAAPVKPAQNAGPLCDVVGWIPLAGQALCPPASSAPAAPVGATSTAAAVAATAPVANTTATGATIPAQLSLSGVATQANILGGSVVGVHPGDTVVFQASPMPTAGLNNIPVLGPLVNSVLGMLLGSQFQVVLNLGSTFPGGARTVAVGGPSSGACKGEPSVPVTFPAAGTYAFSWSVQYVLPTLFGCNKDGINATDLNLLKSAGVALNASNQWTGQIVVAANPPAGGISIQLPGVGIAPSVPVLGQLPSVGIPPVTLPTLPVTIPNLPGTGGNGGSSSAPGGSSSAAGSGTPSSGRDVLGESRGPSIPELVVPRGPGISVPGLTGWQVPLPGVGNRSASASVPEASMPSAGSVPEGQPSGSEPTKAKTIDLAAAPTPSPQMPVILAIIAIIALALVTAIYARLYLLRKVH